jgi:hypothetical protein
VRGHLPCTDRRTVYLRRQWRRQSMEALRPFGVQAGWGMSG